tara:strand:+ start:22729 stop:24516 length:1788 start_codon:yes stop_codon:yes gene_type:complete
MKEIHMIINSLKFRKKLIILLIFLTFVYSLLEGASIGLLLPVLQLVAEGDLSLLIEQGGVWKYLDLAYRTIGFPLNLITLVISIMFIVLLREGLGYFLKIYAGKIQADYSAHLRKKGFNKLIHADISYFNEKKVGNIINTFTNQMTTAGSMIWVFTQLITTSFLMVIYIFLLLMMSWQMTLLAVGVIIILSLSIQRQIKYSRKYGKNLVKLTDTLHQFLSQKLTGARVVKASTMENFETRKFDNIVEKIALNQFLQVISQGKIYVIFSVFATVAILGIFYFSVEIIQMSLAELALFFFIIIRMNPYAMNINTQRHALANTLGPVENAFQTLDEIPKWMKIKSGEKIFTELKESIQLKNVNFSYDKTSVLKNINLKIKKGEMVAIVGASGTGKSTLADLFLRFYDPSSGDMKIDGVDIKDFDIASLRSKIGFVTQDTFLFNDTVEANISYGTAQLSKEEIIKVAKIAKTHNFITKLPKGYQTIIGERGVKLSGGQRQRLALARTMIKKPEIIILDEATSNLDSESEQLILESIKEIRKRCTIIAIAHRLSTIENADRIIVLERGMITEEGKHEDLLKKGKTYSKYYNLQFSERNNI